MRLVKISLLLQNIKITYFRCMLRLLTFFSIFVLSDAGCCAQHLYYKKLNPAVMNGFNDSTGRIIVVNNDSALKKQMSYVLRFFPEMLVAKIIIDFKPSKLIA